MCIAAVFLPAGLFLLAWTGAYPSVYWILPCFESVNEEFSMSCIFIIGILYMVNIYEQYAVSTLGVNAMIRRLISMLMLMTIQVMIRNIHYFSSDLFILRGGLPLNCPRTVNILLKKGPKWRGASRWEDN
jgi:hypothetical protein